MHERTAAAFLVTGAEFQLVDSTGEPFAVVPQPPVGLPELRVRKAAPDDSATKSALTVVESLPPEVRGDLRAVVADRPTYVRLLLRTGDREVRWGSASDSERKAAVLRALLTRPAKVYDVTTPVLPTVT